MSRHLVIGSYFQSWPKPLEVPITPSSRAWHFPLANIFEQALEAREWTRNTVRRGRLSTVDLLNKVARFSKM